MEKIHGYKQSKLINLHDFVLEFKKLFVKYNNHLPVIECNISKAMGIPFSQENSDINEQSKKQFSKIEQDCSIDLLKGEDDSRISEFIPGFTELVRKSLTQYPKDAMKLKTLQNLLKSKSMSHLNPFKRTVDVFTMVKQPIINNDEIIKNNNFKDINVNDKNILLKTLITDNEENLGKYLKISIRIYRRPRVSHKHHTLEKPVFAQEIECLGSNYLTELRDQIDCICNKKHFFDISKNPSVLLPDKETDPGYFFITDTFYNDTRNINNMDYSLTIKDWAATAQGYQDMKFNTSKMQNTRFIDLSVRLGAPQHYLHHGNCEHWFTFSQIEIITDSTSQLLSLPSTKANSGDKLLSKNLYPLQKSYNSFSNKLCNTCGLLHYMYVVVGSNRQLHDPAYLCSKCFLSYHYIDGKKIGNFKAYRLSDTNIVEEEINHNHNDNNDSNEVYTTEDDAEIIEFNLDTNTQYNEEDQTMIKRPKLETFEELSLSIFKSEDSEGENSNANKSS